MSTGQAVASGIAAKAQGGKFVDGVKGAAVGSALTFGAMWANGGFSAPKADITAPQPRLVDNSGDGSYDSTTLVNPNTVGGSGSRSSVFIEELGSQSGSVLTVQVDNSAAAGQAFNALNANSALRAPTDWAAVSQGYASYLAENRARARRHLSYMAGAVAIGGAGSALLATRVGRAICVSAALACSLLVDPGQNIKMPVRGILRHMETRASIRKSTEFVGRKSNSRDL